MSEQSLVNGPVERCDRWEQAEQHYLNASTGVIDNLLPPLTAYFQNNKRLRHLDPKDLAIETAQRVLTTSVRYCPDNSGPSGFEGWVLGIARNVGREALRRDLNDIGVRPDDLPEPSTCNDDDDVSMVVRILQNTKAGRSPLVHEYLQSESTEKLESVSRSIFARCLSRLNDADRLLLILRMNPGGDQMLSYRRVLVYMNLLGMPRCENEKQLRAKWQRIRKKLIRTVSSELKESIANQSKGQR